MKDCIHRIGIWCGQHVTMCGELPGTGLDVCDTAYEREEREDEPDKQAD